MASLAYNCCFPRLKMRWMVTSCLSMLGCTSVATKLIRHVLTIRAEQRPSADSSVSTADSLSVLARTPCPRELNLVQARNLLRFPSFDECDRSRSIDLSEVTYSNSVTVRHADSRIRYRPLQHRTRIMMNL